VTAGSVVTLGETMALLDAPASGRLGPGAALPLGLGGAESNVAIGLARLGVECTWVSRVGDDALGVFLTREIRAEGVRVVAPRDPGAPTGLMIKELRGGRPSRVRYYRRGSAASRLAPADVDEPAVAAAIAGATVLHLTGITAALGPAPLAAVERAVDVARSAGTLVSFDVNHRATLWSDDEAAPVLGRLAAAADLVFAGPEEAALVLGRTPPATVSFEEGEALARGLVARGPATAVVKLGALGALAVSGGIDTVEVHRAPARTVTVVDPVGAGDAFVAGYLAELVANRTVPDCLGTGNAAGAAVCAVRGDWEGLPTRDELADRPADQDVVR
jgi:2-dehydro-3-deoxygluconokinase